VKLGEVLQKERERKKLSLEDTAAKIGLSADDYRSLEAGETPAESWGPLLANIAIQLETPTSRLLAESGKSADCKPGQAGKLITGHRERRNKTVEEMAEKLEISVDDYKRIEAGDSEIETWGPRLLNFAEVVELPVFNFFYPFGLPLDKLTVEDYR
jgi:transcriptional regulator with XRE-family HTH domain